MWGGGYLLPGRTLHSDFRFGHSGFRVTSAYGLGSLLPLVVLFVVVPWFGRHAVFLGQPFFILLVLLGLSALGGGLLTGQLLALSVRSRLALAIAHGVGFWPIFGVAATLPALVGHETIGELGVRFVPVFSVSYCLISGVGRLLAGHGWKNAVRSAGIGLVSGTAGAVVLTVVVSVATYETPTTVQWFLAVSGTTVACLLSSGLAGWWGGRSL